MNHKVPFQQPKKPNKTQHQIDLLDHYLLQHLYFPMQRGSLLRKKV